MSIRPHRHRENRQSDPITCPAHSATGPDHLVNHPDRSLDLPASLCHSELWHLRGKRGSSGQWDFTIGTVV